MNYLCSRENILIGKLFINLGENLQFVFKSITYFDQTRQCFSNCFNIVDIKFIQKLNYFYKGRWLWIGHKTKLTHLKKKQLQNALFLKCVVTWVYKILNTKMIYMSCVLIILKWTEIILINYFGFKTSIIFNISLWNFVKLISFIYVIESWYHILVLSLLCEDISTIVYLGKIKI